MIEEKKLYSLKDVCIIPTPTTTIESRSECDCRTEDLCGRHDYFPLIAAPMSCVLYETNYTYFEDCGISVVIPRTVPFETRLELMRDHFCAFGMDECEEIMKRYSYIDRANICIDVANGHMLSQIELGVSLKKHLKGYSNDGREIKIMGGNIANPETYKMYEDAGFDYVRVGIGSGNGCFEKNTKILMADGSKKPISEIKLGDKIINMLGEEDTVINVICLSSTNLVKINNNITCTPNHEFYVILKQDLDKITDDNLSRHAFWIQAKDLDKKKHLLIKLENV